VFIADAASPPIHALRANAIAERSSAKGRERVYGSGKNLGKTLIIRPISGIARKPGGVEIPLIGKTGECVIRSMWNETACSRNPAESGTKA
jgi:hypothetical protein